MLATESCLNSDPTQPFVKPKPPRPRLAAPPSTACKAHIVLKPNHGASCTVQPLPGMPSELVGHVIPFALVKVPVEETL